MRFNVMKIAVVCLFLGLILMNAGFSEVLLMKTARLKGMAAVKSSDVIGFDVKMVGMDGKCYQYYVANPPLLGLTQPVPDKSPLGLSSFKEYKIKYKEAVDIFLANNKGEGFIRLVLAKPLHPDSTPCWFFTTIGGRQVVIDANTGKVTR